MADNQSQVAPPPPAKGDTTILQLVVRYLKLVALLLLVWIMGYFDFSVSWILLGLFIFMWNETYQRRKKLQTEIAQFSAKNEKDEILARVEDLPSWVFFPDVERAEWLNKMIRQIWPFVGKYTDDLLRNTIEPSIINNLPPSLKSFKFEKIDMGDIAPRIGGVKVYTENVRRDEIVLDMDIFYASDSDIRVKVKGIQAGIKDLQLRGTLRIVFKPLISVMPMIGGITVFFLNRPMIDFNLTNVANALDIPGLSGILHHAIRDQIAAMMVLPNKLPIQLCQQAEISLLKYPLPQGVLRIHVVGAKDLMKADIAFIGKGKSDPYCKLRVGAQDFKTKVINNELNPTWNQFFEAIIDQRMGQILEVRVYDKDPDKDDKIGIVSVDISSVAEKGHMDSWLPLENVDTGLIHLRLTWLNLSSNPDDIDKALEQCTVAWSEEHLSSCFLMVTVDACHNLPGSSGSCFLHSASGQSTNSGGKYLTEPSPYVTLGVGGEKQQTQVKKNTDQPVFEENFKFLVHNPNMQELDMEVYDSKSKKMLGFVTVPVKDLLNDEDMTKFQSYPLKESGPMSKITLRLQLRILLSGTAPIDSMPTEEAVDSLVNNSNKNTEEEGEGGAEEEEPSATFSLDDPDLDTPNGKAQETPTKSAAGSADYSPNSSMKNNEMRRRSGHSIHSKTSAMGSDSGLGKIQITIRYSGQRNRLVVVVHKCIDLSPRKKYWSFSTPKIRRRASLRTSRNQDNNKGGSTPSRPRANTADVVPTKESVAKEETPPQKKSALIPPDDSNLADPFVRLYLLPDRHLHTKKKTQVHKCNLNPIFDETFEFAVNQRDAQQRTLDIAVKNSVGVFSKGKHDMGRVYIDLSELDLNKATTAWYNLQAYNKSGNRSFRESKEI
ncbi:extended synaptotagmin-2-like isoform X2 [Lingula anatina]|uniref:Extended synaptotagmin-2-like isoform X2 n=1 Tax=Lingula anatina TaxID=7574 RepID=A0A1S3I0W1_LINAN|nr:extended synaptotagmin-2-like isoform X2 [Lingula anatina]|eukprot:XP_013391900.1 extended synaptotagmin-2-like isoform X2 [Lingula anatina]